MNRKGGKIFKGSKKSKVKPRHGQVKVEAGDQHGQSKHIGKSATRTDTGLQIIQAVGARLACTLGPDDREEHAIGYKQEEL